jgi:hypothetical protein
MPNRRRQLFPDVVRGSFLECSNKILAYAHDRRRQNKVTGVTPQRFRGKLRITGQTKQPFGLRAEVQDLPVKTSNDQALFVRVREFDVEIAPCRQGVRNMWHDQLQSFCLVPGKRRIVLASA